MEGPLSWRRSLKVAFVWLLVCNFLALAGVYFFRHLPIRVNAWDGYWTHFHWQLKFWLICGLLPAWALAKDLESDDAKWELTRLAFLCGFALGPGLAGAFPFDQWIFFFPPFFFLGLVSVALSWPRRNLRPALRALCLFNMMAFLNGIF